MQVTLRKFNPITDAGLIYSSYPKGVYYGAHDPINPKDDHDIKSKWFKAFYVEMQDQLANGTVVIACMSDSPDTILGYAILVEHELFFVYVKELFRNQGLATLLTKGKYKTIKESNVTKIGHSILSKEGTPNEDRSQDRSQDRT